MKYLNEIFYRQFFINYFYLFSDFIVILNKVKIKIAKKIDK